MREERNARYTLCGGSPWTRDGGKRDLHHDDYRLSSRAKCLRAAAKGREWGRGRAREEAGGEKDELLRHTGRQEIPLAG